MNSQEGKSESLRSEKWEANMFWVSSYPQAEDLKQNVEFPGLGTIQRVS